MRRKRERPFRAPTEDEHRAALVVVAQRFDLSFEEAEEFIELARDKGLLDDVPRPEQTVEWVE